MVKVLVGIVSYNPDIYQFLANLSKIQLTTDNLLIVDNNSSNFKDFYNQLDIKKINYIHNNKNLGIATALNQIFNYAKKNGYNWVLTLDQDSIIDEKLISEYEKYIDLPKVGILTCNISDKDFGVPIDDFVDSITLVNRCITSGSFVSVQAYSECGGFDDWMFIDCVDFDFCENLIRHKYKIYKIPFFGLKHKIGDMKERIFFFRKILILNEKPLRHFYMARNCYYFSRKYKQPNYVYKEFAYELKQRIKVILYEDEKIQKLKYRMKGIKEAKEYVRNNILKKG